MKNNKHKDDDYQIAELVIIAIDFAFKQMFHCSFYQTLWTTEKFAGHLCSSIYQVLKQSTILAHGNAYKILVVGVIQTNKKIRPRFADMLVVCCLFSHSVPM